MALQCGFQLRQYTRRQPLSLFLKCSRIPKQFYFIPLTRCSTTQSSRQPLVGASAKSWVDYFPERTKPYLLLARVDKPVGTLLLFYPCGKDVVTLNRAFHECLHSMVHHHGFLCAHRVPLGPRDVYRFIWCRSIYHAWCRLHN